MFRVKNKLKIFLAFSFLCLVVLFFFALIKYREGNYYNDRVLKSGVTRHEGALSVLFSSPVVTHDEAIRILEKHGVEPADKESFKEAFMPLANFTLENKDFDTISKELSSFEEVVEVYSYDEKKKEVYVRFSENTTLKRSEQILQGLEGVTSTTNHLPRFLGVNVRVPKGREKEYIEILKSEPAIYLVDFAYGPATF